jgi:hypothetical protein
MFIACSADGVGLADESGEEFADLYEKMRAVSPDGPREPLTPKAPGIPTPSPSKSRETSFSSVPVPAPTSVRSRPDSSCRPGSRRRHPGGSGSASTTGEARRSGATRGLRSPAAHRPRAAAVGRRKLRMPDEGEKEVLT